MDSFIKWVGGKKLLLPTLRNFYPKDINVYCEPFLGSGAVYLDIQGGFGIQKCVLSDSNTALALTWSLVVSDNRQLVSDFLDEIKSIQSRFNEFYVDYKIGKISKETSISYQSNMYYECRDSFNEIKLSLSFKNSDQDLLKFCSLFIFLNKTGYNGLYRENLKGEYNASFNKKTSVNLIEKVQNVITYLNKYKLKKFVFNNNFEEIIIEENKNKKNVFFFIDPPYIKNSTQEGYTKYSEKCFDLKEHEVLFNILEEIHKNNNKFLLTNSYNDISINFYKEMFEKSKIANDFFTKKIIDSEYKMGRGKKKIGKEAFSKEIVIKNY